MQFYEGNITLRLLTSHTCNMEEILQEISLLCIKHTMLEKNYVFREKEKRAHFALVPLENKIFLSSLNIHAPSCIEIGLCLRAAHTRIYFFLFMFFFLFFKCIILLIQFSALGKQSYVFGRI